jgi:hypothetical protein
LEAILDLRMTLYDVQDAILDLHRSAEKSSGRLEAEYHELQKEKDDLIKKDKVKIKRFSPFNYSDCFVAA